MKGSKCLVEAPSICGALQCFVSDFPNYEQSQLMGWLIRIYRRYH